MEDRRHLMTKRGVLRPINGADAQRLHDLWSSAGVRRFLWDGEIIPLTRTRAAIVQSEKMFREHGFGLWGMRPDGSTELVGFGGLWPFRDPPELELLYGVAERLWGLGYATEIARSVIDYCFAWLDMLSIRASTDTANAASVRVLEKLGFRLTRREVVGGLDTVFYELRNETRTAFRG
jgi:RimJ/RimL family protein N-acetyltransferase